MNGNQQTVDKVDTGKLTISVQDTQTTYPIRDARVGIYEVDTNKQIEELQTDSSGQTETIDLGTPPIEYSEMPNSPVQPYSEYTVRVEAEGFEEITVNGIQMLPQSTALQNVNLQPKENLIIETEKISIPPHTLWGDFPPKIPEDPVKPLPEAGGYVVLPAPVIPEFVVVHLGVPSDTSVQNVWIEFKDYIKNVASSEIYSTWPESSIRANILAILSFTLNRVYTEWYRGKGYNFTITNSTAYDQAFVYGRNFFDKISVVVDEIFTTYVTKPGIRQPLLTQYCDGARVRCDIGMEQWGSKNLGAEGYDALSILRNYYGTDIYLTQAEKVEGVPISYPGEPLTIGSAGPSVRTIQEQLNTISTHYPAIPKLRVDGIYGNKTVDAVKTFQQIFDLPVSGIVDFATWYQISNIYVGISKLAELV